MNVFRSGGCRCVVALLLTLCASQGASASAFTEQFFSKDDGWLDLSDWVLENAVGFMPVPIVITEPALGAGLGAAALFFHPPEEAASEKVATDFVLPSITAVAVALAYPGHIESLR